MTSFEEARAKRDRDVLCRFYDKLFIKPFCDNKADIMPPKARPRDVAIGYERIQHNGPRWVHYLVVDHDRTTPYGDPNHTVLAALDFPCRPNMVVVNEETGKCHLIWELAKPVWFDPDKPWPTPVRFMKGVQKGLARALGGDLDYMGFMCKNPLYRGHRTLVLWHEPWQLGDLAQHVDTRSWRLDEDETADGRNAQLFQSMRQWGYRTKRNHVSLEGLRDAMLIEADALNAQFAVPLGAREVGSLVRSVARFIWNRWEDKSTVMHLDRALPLVEKQKLGQAYTSEQRKKRTIDALVAAYKALRETGAKITRIAVAEYAGLHVNTAKQRWAEVLALI
jgi:hypothetical protein